VPVSAVDSISPAFQHTKTQLFRPFSLGQWSRLALVGLFAGELSSGGGCNFNYPAHTAPAHRQYLLMNPPNWAVLGPLLILLVFAVPVLWLLFLYINSRMRFILFDSLISKRCEIRRMWRERRDPAFQYFVWQIVFLLVMLGSMAVLIGIPAFGAFLLGWFSAPREHLVPLVLGGILLFFIFLGWLLTSLFVHVFTKDFVVPQMALENLSAFDGWRRLWQMLQVEKGAYAGYAGMKLVMAIGAAFAIGIAAVIVIIILLVPFGGLGAITILMGRTAGLTWNAVTITLVIVAGCVLLLMILYAVSLVSVPVMVFFPAYSIYFFAARYPQLGNVLYPPAPPAPPAPLTPSPGPVA
jgi:hypothetical protein